LLIQIRLQLLQKYSKHPPKHNRKQKASRNWRHGVGGVRFDWSRPTNADSYWSSPIWP